MFQNAMSKKFIDSLAQVEAGVLELITPTGEQHVFAGSNDGPRAQVRLHAWDVLSNMALRGDNALAEDYREGKWESENLSELLLFGLRNEKALERFVYGNGFFKTVGNLFYKFRENTLRGSKRNIHAHYDLGNDFYALWLDPSMTYSSALYKDGTETLEQAQHNKYDRILSQIGTQSADILEVGCGWGGFAERAITMQDHRVKGITLSNTQHDYAQTRLANMPADIVLEDYRHQQGKYDYIVSIEMFEAVGEKFWPVYFKKLTALMKQGGKAVLQTITIDDAHFEQYRQGTDAIRSFIFPGGMLPSKQRFAEEAEKAGLRITDQFSFGQDYARTLDIWDQNFEKIKPQLPALGFDDSFMRLWRFYLASCQAGFESGRTDVMQVTLEHA